MGKCFRLAVGSGDRRTAESEFLRSEPGTEAAGPGTMCPEGSQVAWMALVMTGVPSHQSS